MNERALPIPNAAETEWVATDLDQTVGQELHGRTEQRLTIRVFLWRLLAVGLNIGLFMILFQLYKLVRKTYISRARRSDSRTPHRSSTSKSDFMSSSSPIFSDGCSISPVGSSSS